MIASANDSEIAARLAAIEQRFDVIESLLRQLTRKTSRPTDPQFVSLTDAAARLGVSVCALQSRIKRQNRQPDVQHVRRHRGGLRRDDFDAYVEQLEARHAPVGLAIAANLKRLECLA